MVSGLASSIRAATESATFDLAGNDAASIRATVNDAFSQPLSLAIMIRITFVVGGGKLSRSKYDEKAMQAVTSTLKQMDYVEDRGASCILECGGCFKTQHDTGKNVYTVVVFPRVADSKAANERNQSTSQGDEDYEPLIPTNSPGYKMAVCSLKTFQNLLSTYCHTYFEKKECLRCLEGLLQLEQAIENKMMVGNPLDSGEQAFYDDSSELKEKIALAQKEAGKHVEEGKLTLDEKRALVEMNETKIETLMSEKSSASVAEKLKKALARKQQLQSLSDDLLKMNSASYPPPLRHESQLTALRKKLLPLQALEDSARGRLLTLSETRSLAGKEEIEYDIERLEGASCGWFEEEEIFQERLQKSRERFEAKFARSKRGGGKAAMRTAGKGGGSGSTNAVNKWILPGEKPKGTWGTSGKKKLKAKGGAVFTAMMMDSSSDEEESDDESVESVKEAKSNVAPKKQHTAASNVLASKKAAPLVKKSNNPVPAHGKNNSHGTVKETISTGRPADAGSVPQTKKKKSKKKKKKSKPAQQEEIPDVAEEKIEPEKALSPKDSPSSVSASLLDFWTEFLLPFVMAVLSLIVSLVTSMFAGKNSKKGGKKKRG
mmetsp:Transcript_21478/g.46660  ORF Transcript_21478/g.46660 Transcript_21478/m.46660 type:complete len:603 (-) Transcript_21478:42-1850(-)